MLIGFALPILAAVGIVVLHEAHTSRLQARELARRDPGLRGAPGSQRGHPVPGGRLRPPPRLPVAAFVHAAPGDRDYAITRQAHFSPALMRYAEHRLFPPYAEKAQAGLDIADCRGVPIYDFRYPQRRYANLPACRRWRCRACCSSRTATCSITNAPKPGGGLGSLHPGGAVAGRQDARLQHAFLRRQHPGDPDREIPPLCRRAHRQHRRQAAADLGQRTQLSRRPGQLRRAPGHRAHLPQLGAAGGAGLEVTGLADGLWVWYGADYRQVGEALDGKAGLAAQGLALRQVLALMIAHRRPSFYLAPRATVGPDDRQPPAGPDPGRRHRGAVTRCGAGAEAGVPRPTQPADGATAADQQGRDPGSHPPGRDARRATVRPRPSRPAGQYHPPARVAGKRHRLRNSPTRTTPPSSG